MKKQILIILLATLAFPLHSQVNSTVFYSNDHNIELASTFPSLLGRDRAKVQVEFLGYYTYLNSTSFRFNYARQLIRDELLNNSDVNQITDGLHLKNRFFAGSSFRPVELYFKTGKNLSIGLGTRLRTDLHFAFEGELPMVLWKGNAPYAGQNINLLTANGLAEAPLEIYTAAALSIPNWESITVRAGIRPKLLISYGTLQLDQAEVNMYTEEEGKYIDFDYQFLANTALPGDSTFSGIVSSPQAMTFAMDLGGSVILNKKYHFSASLLDVGRLRYAKNVDNYSGSGSVRYEGVEFTDLSGNIDVNDSLLNSNFTLDHTQNAFNTPLPTRLAVQAMYRISRTKINGREYNFFSGGITFIQGLSSRSTFSDQTFVSVGANINPGGYINIGSNINTYNFKQSGLGANFSFRLFIFHFGVGSSNVLALVSNKSGAYGDLSISGGLNF